MKSSQNVPTQECGDVAGQSLTPELSNLGASVSQSQRKLSRLLLGLIDTLRTAADDPVLPANQMAVLLYVAQAAEAPSVVDLCKDLKFSDAAGTRTVQVLGRGKRGAEGAGLLESQEDPENWSRKRIYLTQKGRDLMIKLEDQFTTAIKKGV